MVVVPAPHQQQQQHRKGGASSCTAPGRLEQNQPKLKHNQKKTQNKIDFNGEDLGVDVDDDGDLAGSMADDEEDEEEQEEDNHFLFKVFIMVLLHFSREVCVWRFFFRP